MDLALTGLSLPLRIRLAEPISDENLLRFSAENQGLPIERDQEGNLLIMSPSGSESARRNAEILLELGLWNRHEGHGYVTDSNGGFTLPDSSVLTPDAAWTSAHRIGALTPEQRSRFAPIAPDFIVELRSPSDSLSDLERKMQLWIDNGVQLAWLIDPFEKGVTVFRSGLAPERMYPISQIAGEGPVTGFVLPLDRVFAS